jgi:anti-anti-sigma regulatory factor
MTLRIEERSEGHRTILRLSGRIQSGHLEELMAHIRRNGPAIVLDLQDVMLVDLAAVRFLGACEAEGIELLHCAPYIRKWMGRERGREE